MLDYDVAVIGGGPAGASFARLAGKKLKIALIDKTGMPGERVKPCGGLLSPDAQKQLARSGLTLPKELLVTPQIFAVKTMDLGSGAVRYYQRSYLNMDRARFDSWLRSLIPEEVDMIRGRCVSISRRDGGFDVSYRDYGENKSLSARYIVGADGADSLVRRTFFADLRIRRYVALQRWYVRDRAAPFYSCVFDPDTSDCCSWSVSKDEYMIYGGAFKSRGCREAFERQLESAAKEGFEFGECVRNEACMVCRPKSVSEIYGGRDGVMLLGEAGGFISPSSLEGISWAMRCAEYASMAFDTCDQVKAYSRLTRRLKLELFFKMLKCPFMYNPLLRRLVMASKITSLKSITDERK